MWNCCLVFFLIFCYYIFITFSIYSLSHSRSILHQFSVTIFVITSQICRLFVKDVVASILSRDAWLLRNFAEIDRYKSLPLVMNFNALSRKSFHWGPTRLVITLLHRNERYCIRSKHSRYEIMRRSVLRQSHLRTRRRSVGFSESRYTWRFIARIIVTSNFPY